MTRIERLHALQQKDRARVARDAGLPEKTVNGYGGVALSPAMRAAIERAAAGASVALPTSATHLDGPDPREV